MIAFAHDEPRARTILAGWLGEEAVVLGRRDRPRTGRRAARRVRARLPVLGGRAHDLRRVDRRALRGDRRGRRNRRAGQEDHAHAQRVTRTEHRPLRAGLSRRLHHRRRGQRLGRPRESRAAGDRAVRPAPAAALRARARQRLDRRGVRARRGRRCIASSRTEALDEIGARLRRFMPGDSYSDLSWSTKLSWEAMEPVLVPVWIAAARYRDDRPPLRIVINGQTGAVHGDAADVVARDARGARGRGDRPAAILPAVAGSGSRDRVRALYIAARARTAICAARGGAPFAGARAWPRGGMARRPSARVYSRMPPSATRRLPFAGCTGRRAACSAAR